MELADTSAWTNRHKSPFAEADFERRVLGDEISTCAIVMMELLWTAQTPVDFSELREELATLPQVDITAAVWHRAIDVWQTLIRRGHHRQVKWVDLVVAAAAVIMVGLAVVTAATKDATRGSVAALGMNSGNGNPTATATASQPSPSRSPQATPGPS